MAMVSIEGSHAAAAPEIFDLLDYRIVGEPLRLLTASALGDQLEQPLPPGRIRRVVCAESDWTHIADFDLILFDEALLWKELSRRWNTRIVCWLCDESSETYAFALYENGELRRQVFTRAGEIARTLGDPLPEETDLAWEDVFEDDILILAEQFGAHPNFLEEDRDCTVYQLEEL